MVFAHAYERGEFLLGPVLRVRRVDVRQAGIEPQRCLSSLRNAARTLHVSEDVADSPGRGPANNWRWCAGTRPVTRSCSGLSGKLKLNQRAAIPDSARLVEKRRPAGQHLPGLARRGPRYPPEKQRFTLGAPDCVDGNALEVPYRRPAIASTSGTLAYAYMVGPIFSTTVRS